MVDKSILITGASSGIGRGCAERFLDEGWQVGLLARRTEPLQELAAGRANAHVLVADVTDEAAVEQAVHGFAKAVGHLDVLFNNAGSSSPGALIDEVPVAEWQRMVDVNLTGMFLAARAAFAVMRGQDPQGGRIINNGSISAHAPRPGSVCYTTTKYAITGLTKTLSLDGRPFDIACGQIDIGNVQSQMTNVMVAGVPQADGSVRPEPVMPLENVVNAVWYMAGLPPEANIQTMTVMATKMPFVGRG